MSLTYQDIGLDLKELWLGQLKQAWKNSEYQRYLSVSHITNFSEKRLDAECLNNVASKLITLQNQKDADFKMDKIKVATEPPSDLAVGEVYFKDLGAVTDYNETGAHYIEPNQKTSDGYDILNYAAQADQIELTYDTAREFGITGKAYTLDEALYAVKQLLDHITTT